MNIHIDRAHAEALAEAFADLALNSWLKLQVRTDLSQMTKDHIVVGLHSLSGKIIIGAFKDIFPAPHRIHASFLGETID